jgi:ATP/maltotriose-dependent transcriptional regulator MalT
MGRQRTAPEQVPPQPTLIETKLGPPRTRLGLVARPRLLDQIDRFASVSLTLVDAPVGFGKTLLVESWLARTDAAVAWVSLEAADNDPARLWTYIATAVDRIRPGLGRAALARLRSPGTSPESVVDDLVNGVHAFGQPVAIVLDDVHVISDELCWRSLEHLVEHLPQQARMIVATRSDPPLPLGRLRARGGLGEIRARDLAFSVDEARELLVHREQVALEDADVELLVERTEGWPAGLYLAALWLRVLDDPRAGVQAFHGNQRHVADYLTGEVLDRLDEDTRRFLLESSVFGIFNARLCDTVLDRSDSAARLRRLERENGFLVALDVRGEWYRYHHLFGELLELELSTVEPDAPARLHTAASAWCREQGLLEDALEHAAAAGDPALVALILAEEHRTFLRSGRLATLLRWSASLPEDMLLEHPEIPLAAILAAGLLGSPAHIRHRFTTVAELARSEREDRWTPYHEGALGIGRLAWVEGDIGKAIAVGRALAAMSDVTEVAVPALASLAFLLFLEGDHAESRARAREALDRPEALERPHGLVLALATLSLIESASGLPAVAEERAREAIAVAVEAGVEQSASGGAARVALASALAARGSLREAEHEAVEGERLRRCPDPEAAHLHALLVLARIRARCGQLDLAAAGLDQVMRGLETFTDAGTLPDLASKVESTLEKARAAAALVLEAPTEAELNVLRLLSTEMSQRQIGAQLYLSVNTVKTHTRTLYRKLGVTSREAAVEQANALGLLGECSAPCGSPG